MCNQKVKGHNSSTPNYAQSDFKGDIKNLQYIYLVNELHILKNQNIYEYMKFNDQIYQLQIFYITLKSFLVKLGVEDEPGQFLLNLFS